MIEFDFKLIENDKDLYSTKESMIEAFEETFSETLKRDLNTIDENRLATLSIEGAEEFHQWLAFELFHEFDYWSDTQELGEQKRRFLDPDLMQSFAKLNQVGHDLEWQILMEKSKDIGGEA